ncbi:hypothetical protein AD998_09735 [bacterium 336/3]|nr:hypothetical protein AD998_09735 [bacterium 336/3]
MKYNDFLKEFEGKEVYYFPSTGVFYLCSKEKMGYTKCTLNIVGEDFVLLGFTKDSMFTSSKSLSIPLGLIIFEFPPIKS